MLKNRERYLIWVGSTSDLLMFLPIFRFKIDTQKLLQWERRFPTVIIYLMDPFKLNFIAASSCQWSKDLYVTYGTHVHVYKYTLTGVSRHEKHVLWSYMYKVLWRREDQLWNQNVLGKVKLIKVQFNALDLFLTRERPYLYFSSDLQSFCLFILWD